MNARNIFLTGATSGVGLLVAKKLLSAGIYELTVTGRNLSVLQELSKLGAHVIQADLTDPLELEEAVKLAGNPDTIIYSAGVGTFALAEELTEEEIQAMLTLNVQAPMILTKQLLPAMKERGSGHFIFLSSQAGKVATPKASVYAATKHAVIGYANALRMEIASSGLFVTVVNPGPIDTPFLDLADKTGGYRKSMGKFLLPAEKVANAVVDAVHHPQREVNLPKYMGISSKLYAMAPKMVETFGRRFFLKK